MISAKIVSVLVLAGALTVWKLLFEGMYEQLVLSQGGTMGIGETFVGFLIVGGAASFITYIIVRRLRQVE